ncbi:unnamed protein product [Rhizophagus irregularis]|uniref:Kinase-like protein n=1 Tax=Rhizophagus irregularis TaxID=588596 RepID=A0A2N1N675_9GLOM|nr:kinase-like protein [Rhizophagus irregularis]CAB4373870.1 unnamed protein product [Rhizophagus irregularis]CAB5382507.1 unnamed protein product [Rhizophagus irregularis]
MNDFIKTVGGVVSAIDPYVTLIETASGLIKLIIEICQAAEYNKKICRALAERVGITVGALELLKLRQEKELRDEVYYDAFNKFIYILEKIKNYIDEISNIQGFRRYAKAIFVKEKFMKLTEEYDTTMKDLNFTLVIANEERRKNDEEALSEDLAEFDKYLRTMGDQVDNIYEEVKYIKKHLDDKTFYGANKIDSKELTLPARGKPDDQRGKGPNFVVRRILSGQEVACKSNSTIEDGTKVQGHLEILMKLSECNHILRFYGVSKIDDNNVRVFEWAHRGTLKELYEKKDIQWHYKVQIALKICRGLIFLQKAEILHHDLRCENILMTESLEPKIYNFNLARYTFGNTTTIKEATNDAVRWLAPEKLIDYKSKYTTQCEIFSFGVLLWELAFEKIPYRSLEVDKIRDFVIKGGREVIKFGNSTPEISKLQESYKKIINDIWKKNPQERISFLKALDMLEELYNSISYMFDESIPALLDDKTLDLDGSKEIIDDDFELSDDFINPIVPTIPLDEGVKAHEANDYQKAWKCFEYHARNGNTTAKCWKGRYLWEGIHDGIKGRKEGKELLKEAADEGHHDAQLYYAFTLKKSMYEGNNIEMFIDYITKAAEGNNNIAQYNLGDIYYKGKLNKTKNEDEGIKWLKKAALNDNNKAIQFLEEKGIRIC